MFKSRQFFIALAIAVFAGLLTGGVYITQRNKLPEIFSYVPINMDQVMVNRAEKNIQNNTNMLIEIPQAVQQQFQQIKVMLIVQDESFSGDQMLFMDTRQDFSPQEFLKTINPEDDITSTYLRLSDGQYLFGPQNIIQNYTKPTKENALFQQNQLKKYISEIKGNSLSIISHNDNSLSTQDQIKGLLDSVEYVLVHINSEKGGKFDFASYVLFGKTQTGLQSPFEPQFKSFLTESTIAYLELGKVAGDIDFGQQKFLGSNRDLLIKKLLSENIAIVISKGANMFNLGISVLSNNKDLFSDLESFFPMISLLLQDKFQIPESQITSINQPGKVGYDVTLQGIQKIGIYLEKNENQTKLSIGNPLIEGKKIRLKGYSKNTLAILHADMNQVLSVYKQFANIGTNGSLLSKSQQDALNQMKDKTLFGEILLDKNAISIKGSIR